MYASKNNVWKSHRSFRKIDTVDTTFVPSLIEDNTRLVSDPNINKGEIGILYYSEESFYNISHSPEYVLSVHPDIYMQIMGEVNDATSIPCGFYFCCHGGDGAHSGVSHDDYVDIRVAATLVTFIIGLIMLLIYTLPVMDDETDELFARD